MAGTTTSAVAVYHGTTSATAGEVDVITLSQGSNVVEVLHRGASGNLFVKTGPLSGNPAALAKESYIVPPYSSDLITTARTVRTDPVAVRVVADVASVPYTLTIRA